MNKKTDNIGDLFAFLKGDFISTQENKKHLPYILFIVLITICFIKRTFVPSNFPDFIWFAEYY